MFFSTVHIRTDLFVGESEEAVDAMVDAVEATSAT